MNSTRIVIDAVIDNPEITAEEIAELSGHCIQTVRRILNKECKAKRIEKVIDTRNGKAVISYCKRSEEYSE